MKTLKTTINLICLIYCCIAHTQNLQLKIKTKENTKNTPTLTYKQEHPNLKSLQSEIKNYQHLLEEYGYYNYKIDSTTQLEQHYTYYFTLNKKINTIYIHIDLELANTLKLQDTLIITQPENIQNQLNTITYQLDKIGQSFSKIQLTNQHITNDTLFTQLAHSYSNTRTLDSITITGYQKFPRGYLQHYAKLKTNKPFSKNNIETKANLLNNIPFIKQTKAPELLFTKDSTTLYLYLEKNNTNIFDGFLGFNSNEETDNIEFNGSINLQLVNNLNSGEEISLYWKNTGTGQSNFKSSIKTPYVFNSPITPSASLTILRQDSLYNNTTFNILTEYQLNSKNTFGVFYQTTNSTNTLTNNSTSNINNYQKKLFGVSYTLNYNLTVNPFNQTHQIKFLGAIGHRDTKTNKTTQQSLELDAFYQLKLSKTLRLYINNQTRLLGSKNYFDNESYFFGGINSIRGFEENSLNARYFSTFNTEIRKLLTNRLYVHSIADFSHYATTTENLKKDLLGFGLGIGILNKNSYFRLNYASGLTIGEASKLNNSKIHVSYSTFF